MEETWKDIIGYNNQYQISNLGRIQSVRTHYRGGQYYGMFLKPYVSKKKYVYQQLRKNNKTYTYLLHRLVAEHFIPNPENKPFVGHLDNDPTNNKVNNLTWCTQQENIQYAVSLGRMKNNSTWIKGRKPWNTDKVLSQEHKNKIKVGKTGISIKGKPVINTETGIIYKSVAEAVKQTSFKYSTFIAMLRGDNKNKTTFTYYGGQNTEK